MSWLSDIAKSVGDNALNKELGGRSYVGNDINLIDTAYSETENHKLSVFFVPGDVSVDHPVEGVNIERRRFYAYLFIPTEEDLDGIPAWDLATNNTVGQHILNSACARDRVDYVGGRTYRQARGYYIYVYEFIYTGLAYNSGMDTKTDLYLYSGEQDGEAVYVKKSVFSKFVENRGVNISSVGIDNSFDAKVYVNYTTNLFNSLNQKSFIVTTNYNNTYQSKEAAKLDGNNVYEILSWSGVPNFDYPLILELTCVCRV